MRLWHWEGLKEYCHFCIIDYDCNRQPWPSVETIFGSGSAGPQESVQLVHLLQSRFCGCPVDGCAVYTKHDLSSLSVRIQHGSCHLWSEMWFILPYWALAAVGLHPTAPNHPTWGLTHPSALFLSSSTQQKQYFLQLFLSPFEFYLILSLRFNVPLILWLKV